MYTCNPIAVGEQTQQGLWGLLAASLALELVRDLLSRERDRE